MITGAQIRGARQLLGWHPSDLAERAKLSTRTINRSESMDGEPPITIAQRALIRRVLETAGIVFLEGDVPDVNLKGARQARPLAQHLRGVRAA
jgi:transcriptional regulator with XRE-family HTH domain